MNKMKNATRLLKADLVLKIEQNQNKETRARETNLKQWQDNSNNNTQTSKPRDVISDTYTQTKNLQRVSVQI